MLLAALQPAAACGHVQCDYVTEQMLFMCYQKRQKEKKEIFRAR